MGCYPLQSITLKLGKLRNDDGDSNNTPQVNDIIG